jgi:poly(3-hydroxybutyrate) depolymerase
VAVQEQVAIDQALLPAAALQALHRRPAALDVMKSQPTVLVVAPLSGHHSTLLRDTVKQPAAGPQGLHHRLDRRPHGAAGGGPLPPRRLRGLRAGVHPHIGPEVHVISVCQPTVPVLAAVSLLASAGEHAAHDDHDGRPHRRPQEPHRGQQPGDEQEPQLVREQRHLPRAANFPGAGRRVYPGFLQHTGFVAMNPDRHLTSTTTTSST